jgi:hypothetical protein
MNNRPSRPDATPSGWSPGADACSGLIEFMERRPEASGPRRAPVDLRDFNTDMVDSEFAVPRSANVDPERERAKAKITEAKVTETVVLNTAVSVPRVDEPTSGPTDNRSDFEIPDGWY